MDQQLDPTLLFAQQNINPQAIQMPAGANDINSQFVAQNMGLAPQMQPYQQPTQVPPQLQHANDVLNQYIQSKQAQRGANGLTESILANRFQPESQDVARSITQTAQSYGAPELFKPVTPSGAMAERYTNELAPYTSMLEAQGKLGTNMMNQAGGATGILINRLMAENPGMSFQDALYKVQTGYRTGTGMDANGNIIALPGAPQALGLVKYGEKAGTNQADLQYAAPIEAEKKRGAGDITDVEKKASGQRNVAETADTLEGLYDALDQSGAAISTQNTAQQNLSAGIRGSSVGQFFGRRFGTPEQSIRNQIQMQIPNLINDIRSATGMSAKAMDSNAELQFYLKMATDPTADIQANRAALAAIRKKYLGGPVQDAIQLEGVAPAPYAAVGPKPATSGGFNIDQYLKEKGLQ